jgi:hypothetical protein
MYIYLKFNAPVLGFWMFEEKRKKKKRRNGFFRVTKDDFYSFKV